MEEDAELQAKIAALSGQINQRKQNQRLHAHRPTTHSAYPYPSQSPRGVGRWSPYGRGGGAGYLTTHKNRTLVLGGAHNASTAILDTAEPTPRSDDSSFASTTMSQPAFVSTRGVGMNQLMTKTTYEREQRQKQEYKEQHATNRSKPPTELATTQKQHNIKTDISQPRELELDGIRYHLRNDGAKLIRIADSKQTPKKVKIADVDFFRTKNGNLIRARDVKGSESTQTTKRVRKQQCEHFTKHGNCPFGPSCRFTHDPTKVAICKDFLRTGSCPVGKNCDLSHELTYHRVPACTHFLRGNCTNDACRYPHVHVSAAAPVCRAFATLGYCARGPDCDKRHVFECPDYSNHGRCANREKGTCSLPHVDRASTLRKAAERQAKNGSPDESDVSSHEDEDDLDHDLDLIDSEVDFPMGSEDESRELSQQKDFISFH